MSHAYRLGSLKLGSDIELPGLPAWDGPPDAAADLVFCFGEVPPRLARPDHVAPLFQTRGRSEYLLAVPGIGRILIRDGREVVIEPEAGADPLDTRSLLTGPVQAVLWHQRGLLPLHANAVIVNGRAVALAGHSAAGKSTLAAALAARGHKVMTDDVCIVDARGGSDAWVLPGYSRLRLWRDALDHLGIATNGLEPALPGKEKYFVDSSDICVSASQKLSALVLLSRRASDAAAFAPLSGFDAVIALESVVHMRRPARALGRDAEIFAALTRLAGSATVWRLTMPDDLACLDEAAARVLNALGA
jgi:hypothetical protein